MICELNRKQPWITSITPTSLKGKILPHEEADVIIQTLINSGFTFCGADWGRDKTDEHSGGPYSTYENKTTNEIITIEPYSTTETKFC